MESNAETIELDEELRATARFGAVLEGVRRVRALASGFHAIRRGCGGGVYVSETMETVLSDEDGKQCVMEALAMFGLILKILDESMIGGSGSAWWWRIIARARGERNCRTRKRLWRCARGRGTTRRRNASGGVSGDVLCQMRDARVVNLHGHRAFAHGRRVQSHSALPESRASLHGARAQGGLLYVILYWAPTLLHRGTRRSREIVDRHTRMGGSSPAALGSPRTC